MNKEINIVYKKLSELKPYENNPRINDASVDAVANSIEEFGFKVPMVIDKDGVIITGHTRYKAAQKLGLEEVPTILADDLNDEQIKAYRIADNKVGENSEWEFTKLKKELDAIKDLDMTDFNIDMDEINSQIAAMKKNTTEIKEDDFDVDAEIEKIEEPKSKLGDIYKLGNHRLMCGDSTKEKDVKKLINGNKIDILLTDPPYNINYVGVKDKRKIKNDKMSDEDFIKFLEKSLLKTEMAYIFCSWQYSHLFRKAMENLKMAPKSMIIWNKINPAQNLDKYFKQHEIIWYYGEFGGEKTLRGDIWECKRQRNILHPTMKPIELLSMILNDNPKKELIYDAFGGSGSTLIACEQLDRKCYMMELDPKYVDVIIKRWEDFTGKKAEKIEDKESE